MRHMAHPARAQPMSDEDPSDLLIETFDYIPWGKDNSERFRTDAAAIVDAMEGALPGGTMDAILVELLDRKRSQLVVRCRP